MTDKQRSEQYFSQKGNINSARPDDLPPSQGGKYAGFGSSYQPEPEKTDDPMAILSKGWSFFSTTAMSALSETTKMALTASEAIGNKINEQVIEPTTKAVRDPEFQNNLTSNLLNVGAKIGNQIGAVGVVVGNQVAGAVRDGVDGIRDVLKDNSAPTYKSHVEERFYEGNNVTREDVYHETNETVDQEPANNDSWNEPAQHDSWDKPVEDKKSKDDDWGAEW